MQENQTFQVFDFRLVFREGVHAGQDGVRLVEALRLNEFSHQRKTTLDFIVEGTSALLLAEPEGLGTVASLQQAVKLRAW